MNELNTITALLLIRKQIIDIANETTNKSLQIDLLECIQDLRLAVNYYFEGDDDMNNSRRVRLEKAKTLLNQASNIIDDVMNEEDFAFNNLSEGLQQTMRGEQMEENISEMEEALDNIQEAINNIDNIE